MKKIRLLLVHGGSLILLSGCIGLLPARPEADGSAPWYLALLGLGGRDVDAAAPVHVSATPPTIAISAQAGIPIEALRVSESTIPVPSRINGNSVPVGKVYDVGPEAPMDQFPFSLMLPTGEIEIHYKYDKAALADANLTEEFIVYYLDKTDSKWKSLSKINVDAEKGEVTAYSDHMTPFVLTAVPPASGSTADPPACINQDFPSGIGGTGGAVFTVVDSGFRYYHDRDYTIIEDQAFIDLGFSQALGVSTCNGGSPCGTLPQHKLNVNANYISFTAHTNLDVYLMYDTRGGATINDASRDAPWIASAGFTNTGRFIQTTDAVGYYRVYQKTYAQGANVVLHGNRMGVTAGGIQTNYWVVIKRQGTTGISPASTLCEAQPDPNPPQGITNLKAIPGQTSTIILWQNPDDVDFAGTVIRRSLVAPPSGIGGGIAPTGVVLHPQGYRDQSLAANQTYYYTVFALDANQNFRPGASISVTTGPDTDGDGIADSYESATVYPSTLKSDTALVDTDGDLMPDGTEIENGTDPTVGDVIPPAVTFTLASTTPTNNPLLRFALNGTDNVGITGWMITQTADPPPSYSSNWSASRPDTKHLSARGVYTYYAWARDAAGNVSSAVPSVTVDLEGIKAAKYVYLHYSGNGFNPSAIGGIMQFNLDGSSGSLTYASHLARTPSECYSSGLLAISPYAKTIFASCSGLRSYAIDELTGAFTQATTLSIGNQSGIETHASLPIVYSINSDTHVSAPLTWTGYNPTTGIMTTDGSISFSYYGRGLTKHPNGEYLYLTSTLGSANGLLNTYQLAPNGTPSLIQSISLTGDQGDINTIAVTPDGRFLFLMDSYRRQIRTFNVLSDGTLSNSGYAVSVANPPFHLVIRPDGKFLYAALYGMAPGTVAFSIDSSTGQLTEIQSIGNTFGTNSLTMDPNGDYLFASGTGYDGGQVYPGQVETFISDPATGMLTLKSTFNMQAVIADGAPRQSVVYATHDANDPPIVNAGSERWTAVGQATALSGNASSDPDAVRCGVNPANYVFSWSFASVPAGSTLTNASIINASSKTSASFTPDVSGDYILRLQFTDHPGSCAATAKTASGTVKIKAGLEHRQNAVYVDTPGSPPVGGAVWITTRTDPYTLGQDHMWAFFLLDSPLLEFVCKAHATARLGVCTNMANFLGIFAALGNGACHYAHAVALHACSLTFRNRFQWFPVCVSSPLYEWPQAYATCDAVDPNAVLPGDPIILSVSLAKAHFWVPIEHHKRLTGYWSWWTYN